MSHLKGKDVIYSSGSQRWKHRGPPKINAKNLAAHLTHFELFWSLLGLKLSLNYDAFVTYKLTFNTFYEIYRRN